jgi:hypothetical protein
LQIGLGGGMKCGVNVWRALRDTADIHPAWEVRARAAPRAALRLDLRAPKAVAPPLGGRRLSRRPSMGAHTPPAPAPQRRPSIALRPSRALPPQHLANCPLTEADLPRAIENDCGKNFTPEPTALAPAVAAAAAEANVAARAPKEAAVDAREGCDQVAAKAASPSPSKGASPAVNMTAQATREWAAQGFKVGGGARRPRGRRLPRPGCGRGGSGALARRAGCAASAFGAACRV